MGPPRWSNYMLYSLGILSLEIELDEKAIVDVLCNSTYVNNVVSLILDFCRQLAQF